MSLEGGNTAYLQERARRWRWIGTILPGYEEISESPKLPALVDQYMINQHWQSLLDSNGIVGPDGERIPTETGIQNVTDGKPDQLHVIFDTGFTFPQVSRK